MSNLASGLTTGSLFGDFLSSLTGASLALLLPAIVAMPALPPLLGPAPDDVTWLERESELIMRQLEALPPSDLHGQLAPAANAAAASASAAASRRELLRARFAVADLALKVAAVSSSSAYSVGAAPVARSSRLEPSFFIVNGDRIAQIDERNGSFQRVHYNDGSRAVRFAPNASAGEALERLAADDSSEGAALRAITPDKGFVFVFVAPDDKSFASFYRLRKLLQQRQLGIGWEPLPDDGMVRFGEGANSGGRSPTMLGAATP